MTTNNDNKSFNHIGYAFGLHAFGLFALISVGFCQQASADGFLLPDTTPKNDWVEQQQNSLSASLNKTAHKLDTWFGMTDPNNPAKANLRVIIDNNWSQTGGVRSKIRLRGKVKLPTLERKLSVVFGDDRLEEDQSQKTRLALPKKSATKRTGDLNATSPTEKIDTQNNASLAVRWSDFSEQLPFKTDFDVGIRSRGNVFVRLKIGKDWQFGDKTKLVTEQTYRYSKRGKNEFFSHWEGRYQQSENIDISAPINLEYHENRDDDLNWNASLLQTRYYKNQQKLSYGLYASGFVNDYHANINRIGTVVSWRQPIWRKWLFLQTDLDYLNNKRDKRAHEFGGLVRLEMLF
ncbi:hypothetical protein MOMA_08406 [Moraxella macacae 0408225]|uniref:Selenocysteine synthase n=1 Tax=Moraxella macacae 0408225 TaxID=1230338 RepID=L2F6A3_9GAMM|nr:hypothetical protein [Moraxella macacae]ELA08569.1 hypothetical protein MOMA_08406 [Moraxella macacae 0408225]